MLFTLIRKDGRWLLKDIDFETEASAKEEIKDFREANPDAKEIPAGART